MADRLQAAVGKFLLSINDRHKIRELFAWADVEAVKATFSVSVASTSTAKWESRG